MQWPSNIQVHKHRRTGVLYLLKRISPAMLAGDDCKIENVTKQAALAHLLAKVVDMKKVAANDGPFNGFA